MKVLALMFPAMFALSAAAQSTARPPPKGSEVVDKVLPPPVVREYSPPPAKADAKADPKSVEPEVTVRKVGDDTIEEYRVRGKLYKQRVTPAKGPAYTLIDEKGEGKFTRIDGPDLKYAVPMWVLLTW